MQRLILLLFLLLPSLTVAQGTISDAGTAQYLLDNNLVKEQQLETPLKTEDRQSFEVETGLTSVSDPAGDVLERSGRISDLELPWGDITNVETRRDQENWIVEVTLADSLSLNVPQKAQLFVYANTREAVNNAPGVRGGMDREFSFKTNPEQSWHVGFRWYNPDADFWAINKETATEVTLNGNIVTFAIPVEEIGQEDVPWRVVMAISDGVQTQLDVAPGIGLPPAQDAASNTSLPISPGALIVFSIAVILLIVILVTFSRKPRAT